MDGTEDFIALGSSGAPWQDENNQDRVVKPPLKLDVSGCSADEIRSASYREFCSELSISREKRIYQALTKDANILECLGITGRALEFPY